MFGKEVRIFLKGEANESYHSLKDSNDKDAKVILSSFERKKIILKENPQSGNPIRKGLIPKRFKEQGIHNLYRVALARYWRMLYTLEGDARTVYVFILAIIDHKTYDAFFGYRKR